MPSGWQRFGVGWLVTAVGDRRARATLRNVQPEVLHKLTGQYLREGYVQAIARLKAQDDMQRLAAAGIVTLPCPVEEFIARAGLLEKETEATG